MDEREESPDEDEDTVLGTTAEISPELDPRALPKSVGLSFTLKLTEDSTFSFCATWARYKKDGNDCLRIPKFHVEHIVSVASDNRWRSQDDHGVTILFRRTELAPLVSLSLYLINDTRVYEPQKK